jgi:hypothetical protein
MDALLVSQNVYGVFSVLSSRSNAAKLGGSVMNMGRIFA